MINEMKMSNRNYINKLLFVILALIAAAIVFSLLYFIFSFKIKFFYLVISVFVLVLMILLINVKYLEFESSGMVLSIRHYHPLKKGWIVPLAEFPVQMLEDFSLKNRNLVLHVRKENDQIGNVYLRLSGFSSKQIKTLDTLFSTITKKN